MAESGVSWLESPRHCSQHLECLVCTVANPLILISDPLPALSQVSQVGRGQGVQNVKSSFIHYITTQRFINRLFTNIGCTEKQQHIQGSLMKNM